MILPPKTVPENIKHRLVEIAEKVAKEFEISGPFNGQIIWSGEDLKVIEINLRASRRFLSFFFFFFFCRFFFLCSFFFMFFLGSPSLQMLPFFK